MGDLVLLKNTLSHKDRIQERINRFSKEFMMGDGDIEQLQSLMQICSEYLYEYADDPTLNQAYVRLNESIYWLDSFCYGE